MGADGGDASSRRRSAAACSSSARWPSVATTSSRRLTRSPLVDCCAPPAPRAPTISFSCECCVGHGLASRVWPADDHGRRARPVGRQRVDVRRLSLRPPRRAAGESPRGSRGCPARPAASRLRRASRRRTPRRPSSRRGPVDGSRGQCARLVERLDDRRASARRRAHGGGVRPGRLRRRSDSARARARLAAIASRAPASGGVEHDEARIGPPCGRPAPRAGADVVGAVDDDVLEHDRPAGRRRRARRSARRPGGRRQRRAWRSRRRVFGEQEPRGVAERGAARLEFFEGAQARLASGEFPLARRRASCAIRSRSRATRRPVRFGARRARCTIGRGPVASLGRAACWAASLRLCRALDFRVAAPAPRAPAARARRPRDRARRPRGRAPGTEPTASSRPTARRPGSRRRPARPPARPPVRGRYASARAPPRAWRPRRVRPRADRGLALRSRAPARPARGALSVPRVLGLEGRRLLRQFLDLPAVELDLLLPAADVQLRACASLARDVAAASASARSSRRASSAASSSATSARRADLARAGRLEPLRRPASISRASASYRRANCTCSHLRSSSRRRL